jgi:hypothetical protein
MAGTVSSPILQFTRRIDKKKSPRPRLLRAFSTSRLLPLRAPAPQRLPRLKFALPSAPSPSKIQVVAHCASSHIASKISCRSTIYDADKSAFERALAVLDAALASEEGRAGARTRRARARQEDVPRVRPGHRAGCLGDVASGPGAPLRRGGRSCGAVPRFRKLLLLLQVGCRDATKEKGHRAAQQVQRRWRNGSMLWISEGSTGCLLRSKGNDVDERILCNTEK